MELSSWGERIRCRFHVLGPAWQSTGSGGLVWRARERIGEAREVCWRASRAAVGPKAQLVDGLGLGHGHVGQVIGAEMLCECAGVARWSTAAGAVATVAGGLGLMRLPCSRVWTA